MSLVTDFQFHQQIQSESLGPLATDGFTQQLDELHGPLESFAAARTTILADQNLTEIGRQNAIIEARTKAEASIVGWTTAKVDGVAAQVAALEAKVAAAFAASVPAFTPFQIEQMSAQLLRIHDSPDGDLHVKILDADASDDERRLLEVASATLGRQPTRRGPNGEMQWSHVLDPDLVQARQRARLAAFDPTAAATLDGLNRIKNAFAGMSAAAKSLLR
jgi:hypothetical protein